MNTMTQKAIQMLLEGSPLRIQLIGVAGSGMSGIAGLLLSLGHEVSGSDRVSTQETQRLERLGLKFFLPQTAATVHGAELVVYSSAIRDGNSAFEEAKRLNIPMLRRAEALAAIMAAKKGIVVAGMHGKTTTSAMAAYVLRAGGLNPSHYVGAEIPILGVNAHWDPEGDYFIAEGDESDGSLVNYFPEHTIILNIEREHLDFYKNLDAIQDVFRQLIRQTHGKIVYCADDPLATALLSDSDRSISYGSSALADYKVQNIVATMAGSQFDVVARGKLLGNLELGVPGLHNVSNALAVIALATELGVEFEKMESALVAFRSARRRFEVKLQREELMVVDDYGHHPTEIKATLSTARFLKGDAPALKGDAPALRRKRVVAMFQPHRYSRTQALKDEFADAFNDADLVYVTDIYPASELPIPGVSGNTIVTAARKKGHPNIFYFPDRRELHHQVARTLKDGDVLISLGAGDIHLEATKLIEDMTVAYELRKMLGKGIVNLYEPLSKHTTLRVGGPAQFWIEPETRGGLASVLDYCATKRIPVMFIGRGSNLLVKDGGIKGAVIHLSRGDFIELRLEEGVIYAGAGVRLKQLAATARNAEIGGLEWMEGIPGSVGGSLRMNAGAMGTELFDRVVSVDVVNLRGEFGTMLPSQMTVHYRSVPTLEEQFVVSAVFSGALSSRPEIDRLMERSASKRRASQPIASSAGCIFKNPLDCPAGKLVEELGLKNASIGAARVSEIHGNFIVNDGGAYSKDVLELIWHIQETAKRERGVVLETEVQIVGEEPGSQCEQ
jgi:UDP-N-acetylmuramate--alanine ligase